MSIALCLQMETREMAVFELPKEIKKDVFRLATSMGQDEKNVSLFLHRTKKLTIPLIWISVLHLALICS